MEKCIWLYWMILQHGIKGKVERSKKEQRIIISVAN
jgi:hypothetical protein